MAKQPRKAQPKKKAAPKRQPKKTTAANTKKKPAANKKSPAKKSQADAARKKTAARKAQHPADTKTYWLDDKNNVKKIFWALVTVCIALVAADAFYHKHVHYAFEGIFGFFGLFGFGLSFLLVLASKELRKILMRDEDYYDR